MKQCSEYLTSNLSTSSFSPRRYFSWVFNFLYWRTFLNLKRNFPEVYCLSGTLYATRNVKASTSVTSSYLHKTVSHLTLSYACFRWIDDDELLEQNEILLKGIEPYLRSLQASDSLQVVFEPSQNLSSGFVEWSYAVVIITTSRH